MAHQNILNIFLSMLNQEVYYDAVILINGSLLMLMPPIIMQSTSYFPLPLAIQATKNYPLILLTFPFKVVNIIAVEPELMLFAMLAIPMMFPLTSITILLTISFSMVIAQISCLRFYTKGEE